ncbi:MAG: hypothetical protein CL844_10280 [Crocinitomicaceae bacterium]|nr:hypothetical protein [Crocinitomicaceae bacterium]MBB79374.1 hypothetical protein [Crocinitomicaceae bacterium]|tara:strand:- start:14493 stop:15125 length:633 start_codon:yes stop_codon:yes gene_type:complete
MLNKIIILLNIFFLVFLSSCKSDSEKSNIKQLESPSSCFYSYNEGTTKFSWEAYKTSERVGVLGGFNEIEVKSKKFDDPISVIESISFEINTSSVETNNLERNGKILKYFFETINTPTIKGSIISLNDDGTCKINIKMNLLSYDVIGKYSLAENIFSFTSIVDVSSWNAMSGIIALNNVCRDVHTGKDGISKLWPQVRLSLTTKLKSDCD